MKFRYLGYDEWDTFVGTNDLEIAKKMFDTGDYVVIDCVEGTFLTHNTPEDIEEILLEDLE